MKKGLAIPLSCHLFGYFLGIESLDFPELWDAGGNPYQVVCDRVRDFFAPKIGEMGQNQGFLNLKKNLFINFH